MTLLRAFKGSDNCSFVFAFEDKENFEIVILDVD